MNRRPLSITRGRLALAGCALVLAISLGRASGTGGLVRAGGELAMQSTGSPPAAATATRQAELAELSSLRTQVAQSALACTPAVAAGPASTPTPAPPADAGSPVPFGQDWTVTVLDISMMPTVGNATASGLFAKVSIIAVNQTDREVRFPYDTLLLRDSSDRVFLPSIEANSEDIANWYGRFPPSVPKTGYVYFGVAADAQGPFILESRTDPTFRVRIEVEVRG